MVAVVTSRLHSELLHLVSALLEWAITRQKLATAYWTLFTVATWHVKLAFEDSAVVARKPVGAPIVLFAAMPNTRHGSPAPRRPDP